MNIARNVKTLIKERRLLKSIHFAVYFDKSLGAWLDYRYKIKNIKVFILIQCLVNSLKTFGKLIILLWSKLSYICID